MGIGFNSASRLRQSDLTGPAASWSIGRPPSPARRPSRRSSGDSPSSCRTRSPGPWRRGPAWPPSRGAAGRRSGHGALPRSRPRRHRAGVRVSGPAACRIPGGQERGGGARRPGRGCRWRCRAGSRRDPWRSRPSSSSTVSSQMLQPVIADAAHFLVRGISRDLDFHLAGRAHTAIAVRRLLAGHPDLHSHHGIGLLRHLSIARLATVTARIAVDYGRRQAVRHAKL